MTENSTRWSGSTKQGQNATFKFKLKRGALAIQALVLLWGLVSPGSYATASQGGSSCSFDAEAKRLWCSMRTLSGQLSNQSSGAQVQSSARASHITVQCSDVFFYESHLRTNHFGYLPNLKHLDLKYCKIRKIPALAFSGLSGLRELNVETHNSEWSAMVLDVERDAFTGLNDLRRLNFTQNNLWTMPEASFCGLNSLVSLNLSRNFLQDVSDLGFASSNSMGCRLPLLTLDVSHNGLTKLPKGSFGQLGKLQTLLLHRNSLTLVEDGAFDGLPNLRTLSLSDNQLVALPTELFSSSSSRLSRLQNLYLQNNSLSSLAPRIFEGLDQLLVLNISFNEISNEWLNQGTFGSLKNLVALDLSHNRLARLDQSVFQGLESLQVLYLTNNQIHTVSPNTFGRQSHLHILSLSNNQISDLHPRAFYGLTVLKALSLDHNELSNVHRNTFKNCSSLQDLALNNNKLTAIPKAIKHLNLLRILEVGGNLIRTVHNDSFKGLNNLYALSLAGNNLEEIKLAAFRHVGSLEILNLAHNRISKLDHEVFHSLVELQILRMDNNKLKDINGLLTAQSELRWLNISSNHIEWFDYANIPKGLKWLDLHNNNVKDLGNYYSLYDGFSLRTLDAGNNKIEKLSSLNIPNSVEFVFLNGNQITEIEQNTFLNKSQLSRVELKSNLIEKLQLSSLAISNQIQGPLPEFLLGGNPFFCDCEMEWLQQINQLAHHRQHPRVMDLDNVQCRLNNDRRLLSRDFRLQQKVDPVTGSPLSPPDDAVPIMQVRKQDFLCQYQAHCFAVCLCCEFLACDCRMQCPDGCTCYHDSTWSANVIQCSMRGHSELPQLIPMDATSLYLDGNNFTGNIISQAFIGRKRVQNLYLNNSQISIISNQTFTGLTELEVLHLEDNYLTAIKGHEFGNLTSLRELHLQRNQLTAISPSAFQGLNSLEVLQLHDNMLVAVPMGQLNGLQLLSTMSLAGNPLVCQCDFVDDFHHFLEVSAVRLHRLKNTGVGSVIYDLQDVKCFRDSDHKISLPLGENITCTSAAVVGKANAALDPNTIVPLAASLIALCVVIAVASIMLFVFRTPLRVWVYSKYGVRLGSCCSGSCCGAHSGVKSANRDRLYDAFVSYSLNDEDFVQQVMVPQLEVEDLGFHHKLCLQHRDLPSNSSIADTFPGVSQLCARHVLIVTRSYLDTEWTLVKYAIQGLHKKWRPIIVMLEELTSLDLASAPEFNLLLKTSVVLKYGEAGFWNKLRYYLPDRRKTKALPSSCSPALSGSAMLSAGSPKSVMTTRTPQRQRGANWGNYDNVPSNNSSTSTRSTATPAHRAVGQVKGHPEHMQLVPNPMDLLNQSQGLDQWSDDSAYSWHDHTYQSVQAANQAQQPIYQTLDGDGQPLGSLDVMLPNGQMVAATLMRNNSGKIVPVVQVPNNNPQSTPVKSGKVQPASSSNTTSSTSTTSVSPPPSMTQLDQNGPMQVTFPKTIVYKADNNRPSTAGTTRHGGGGSGNGNGGGLGSPFGGFTNPHGTGRPHQMIHHSSPSKKKLGSGYLV